MRTAAMTEEYCDSWELPTTLSDSETFASTEAARAAAKRGLRKADFHGVIAPLRRLNKTVWATPDTKFSVGIALATSD